jgi:DNA-binding HxlR family transcriptional regulator
MKRGFGQFCPVAMACEVFAERWTPIILRELFAGSHRFNEIHRCMPLISRALLARRLRGLEAAGVITSKRASKGRPGEYHLTVAGKEFRATIEALGAWGQRWTVRVQPHNLDAGLLMWNMRRRVAVDRLPEDKVVLHFSYRGFPPTYRGPRRFWMTLERSGVDLCLSDPGFEVNLHIDADIGAMAGVWLGDVSFAEAVRANRIRLIGPRTLARQFPHWLLLSPFASVPRSSTRT